MSVCNEKNQDKKATSRHLISHIQKIETPMHDVRDFMVKLVKQYQKIDKIGYALRLFDRTSSLIDNVSWCSIVGKMDHHKDTLSETSKGHLTELVSYLDELANTFNTSVILKIQQYRDKWMLQVILWDLVALLSFVALVITVFYTYGSGFEAGSIKELIQYRPLFFILGISTIILLSIVMHFIIRGIRLKVILDKLDDSLPKGMSLSKALNYNARAYFSVFRPVPAGWNFLQRKRLQSISNDMEILQEDLGTILARYSDSK